MTTKEKTRIELSTECSCTTLDEDDNEIESYECFGCYDDEKAYLIEQLGLWLNANAWDDDVIIRVSFSGVSWQRVAGYGDITVSDIPEFLHLNGEFRIAFDLTADYKTLTAVRYSHDEPMGTGLITFTKSPFSRCDYCGDVSEFLLVNNEITCGSCYRRNSN